MERFLRDKSGEVTGILYTQTASKHFDEQLIAIEEILGDELHWGSRRSVVEARDDDIGRFVKSGTSRQLLGALPLNLQNRRAFRNVPNYRAGTAYGGPFADWVENVISRTSTAVTCLLGRVAFRSGLRRIVVSVM